MSERFVIRRQPGVKFTEYWTGHGWSLVGSEAKRYSCDEGQAVIDKRFHRQCPVPEIVDEYNMYPKRA